MIKRAAFASMLGLGLALGCFWLMDSSPRARAASVPDSPHDAASLPTEGAAAALHVCPAGPPTCDFSTVQAAVDAAESAGVIKVAQGTYTDIHVRGGLTQVVYISKTLTVRGGYTTSDWTSPNPLAHAAILDAQQLGRVMVIKKGKEEKRGRESFPPQASQQKARKAAVSASAMSVHSTCGGSLFSR